METKIFEKLSEFTIGEVVTNHPELVRVFMAYNVDFCCGGDRNVMVAIKGDTDEVTFEALLHDADAAILGAETLTTADGLKIRLSDFTTEQLITRIESTHHQFLRDTMPRLSELLFKILSVHGQHHPELFKIHKVFGGLKTELESHMVKEEKLLFPTLIGGSDDCGALILELENEHDVAGDALHQLTDLTDHFTIPRDGCHSYKVAFELLKELVTDMYMHVHTENNVLFKRFM